MAISVDDLRQIPLRAIAPRTMLGVGLAAAAALLVLFVTRPPATVSVLVAGSDLPAGTPLVELEIDVRQVESADGLVAGDDIGDLGDWVLAAPVTAGEPLLPSLLRPAASIAAPHVIAIELEAGHAVLGQLTGGDRVDIFATSSRAGEPTETELIATSIYILEARLGASTAGPERVELLLAVDRPTARALTNAIHAGDIDLIRVGP